MSTYTQIIYQIVFSTYRRRRCLHKQNRPELFKYISGVIQAKKCHLFRINGVEDHLHIVTHLHPSLALSNLVKDIKIASSIKIKESGWFSEFQGWQEGYGAFTYSIKEKDRLIEYVKNQEAHHSRTSSRAEIISLLKANGVAFDQKYL